ncbi:MAG TPA: DNA mismatch repair endonuclease MutL, partial [Candidatus Dojkabacteria bacterium]|nr:DNA mismatch repair endonuclease MutL [Candidatus Dojkabacteria bacterium]
MQQIKILPQEIINKIAAGEVVERPASVVKELLENSIDAGATEIKVKIEKGGNQLIEVSDNASGMDKANAELSLRQHATSKIKTDNDLYRISTMGFRGEALASIASVSDLSLFTSDGASQPVMVKLAKDIIVSESAPSRKQGTTVTVRNIFFKIPA